ncbi:MAG: TonB-dependent receptor [Prevotella sp.]|nr:TonB-dependent receptor [Prevotella sp.]MBR6191244.1 TonB-dependent receptor [Prevotella sp.]
MSEKIKNVRYALVGILLLLCASLQAQTVTGNVKDNLGEPVIGATVMEKGTQNGTVTDFDGNFTIKMSSTSHDLQISYIGMKTATVKVSGKSSVDVVLEDDATTLNEVVAIGYTSKARKDLTGSVGSVSGAKLAIVPVTSAAVALQGKVSGVQVTTVDGQPGADVNIRVRGGTSITQTNEPLYIVDGFQVSNINDIPPTDIASIDILKDASLTAIYGAKGGNGVVVVTTKSAQAGKVTVSFNGNLSVSHLAKKLDLMNAQQFVNYQYQWHQCDGTRSSNGKFFRSNFGNPYDLDMYSTLPSHDWQDEVMGETPLNYSSNFTVGGGSDKVKFNISLTNSEDKGIILGSGVRRTNLNVKTNVEISPKLTMQFNPKFTFRRDEGAGGDNIGTGGIIDVLRYRPTNGLREFGYIDASYADPNEENLFTYTNPKNDIAINQLIKHTYTYTNGLSLEWKPIKGLTLRTEATIGLQWQDQSRFWGGLTDEGSKNEHQNLPLAQLDDNKKFSYVWTNTANYNFSVDQKHNWSFLLGQEINHSQTRKHYQTAHLFPFNFTAREAWNNMGFGTPYKTETTLNTSDRTASFFGQVSYNYKHRYLLAATLRADGSTKFAPGYQWGWFPSVSGAWVISEEEFMKQYEWIDQLKLRAAIGLSGNNRIDSDMWRVLYQINSTGGPGFGEQTQYGEKYYGNNGGSKFQNGKIKWETTVTRNIAADISLFGGRLTITPEFYWNTTRDLLYKSYLDPTLGYDSQMQNIGQVTNKGIEFSVSGDILRGKDYVLSANINFGWNKKKIDKLNGVDNVVWESNSRWKSDYNDYCLKVGDEVGLIYGFVYDGLYQFDEFYFDPLNNYIALPWGSSATDNNTSRSIGPRADGYVTVINDVSGSSNSGIATLPGKIKFKDLDGDGRITENDRTVIGNTNPKIQGGFGLSGQWKDFDFTANFTYMLDFDINNATAYTLSSSEGNKNKFYNVLAKYADCWQYNDLDGSLTGTPGDILYRLYYVDGGTEIYKQANQGRTLWNPTDVTKKITNSYFIEDGSFLRCSDLTIGYTLPKKITQKAGISKARFYVSASNLFIITSYSGYDPEVDIQTGLTCGMDYNRYPRSRTFSFGTNITF